jgi:hypothetical protein
MMPINSLETSLWEPHNGESLEEENVKNDDGITPQ